MPSDSAVSSPFAFGDVVLVPFPFTSQVTRKQRPAVVASSERYGVERPDVVLMAITSQLRPVSNVTGVNWGEIRIVAWEAAGLLKPSVIKPVLATFEQRLVLRRLGALAPADAQAFAEGLFTIIGPLQQSER